MNADGVKRIVALTRQKKSYQAMVRSKDLTQSEADAMIALCDKEIAALRAQEDLPLAPPGGVPAPPGGVPARGAK